MKTFIIAEIGVNHNGKIDLAKKLIKIAKNSGADAVKFQSYISKDLVSKKAKLASYQKKKVKHNSMLTMLERYELKKKDQKFLFKYCKKANIEFISSAFDLSSLDFLANELNLKRLKVPSGEITNLPYLKELAKTKKPIILSTGMANTAEIQRALKVLKNNGVKNNMISILHCNTAYPTPINDSNLKSIPFLKKKFKLKVGFSDHTIGMEAALAAVTLGANIIEKHLTLNKKLIGPDHASSMTPNEFKNMVLSIRKVELCLGKKNKPVTKSEKKNIKFVRKSIVAKKTILKGEKFNHQNLTTKRPGTGISPFLWNKVLKLKAKKNFKQDELIKI